MLMCYMIYFSFISFKLNSHQFKEINVKLSKLLLIDRFINLDTHIWFLWMQNQARGYIYCNQNLNFIPKVYIKDQHKLSKWNSNINEQTTLKILKNLHLSCLNFITFLSHSGFKVRTARREPTLLYANKYKLMNDFITFISVLNLKFKSSG